MSETKKRRLKSDMSQEAVDQRLRDLSELYRLGLSIKEAAYVGKAKAVLNQNSLSVPLEPERLKE